MLQQRYYEGGVAFGFAASADDPGQVDDVFRRQPAGGQPLLDVRRITNTDPLRSTAEGGAVGVGETVWLVGMLEPADPSLVTGMEPSLADCLTGAGPEPYERFGALYVYRIACEVEAGSESTDAAVEAAGATARWSAGSAAARHPLGYCSADVSRARLSSTVERSGCVIHSSSVSSRLSRR